MLDKLFTECIHILLDKFFTVCIQNLLEKLFTVCIQNLLDNLFTVCIQNGKTDRRREKKALKEGSREKGKEDTKGVRL